MPERGALFAGQLGNAAAPAAVHARRSGNRPGGQATVSAPRACLFGSQVFAGFALDVAGGAVLLLPGFHISDEIVRRASLLAHRESLIGSAVLCVLLEYCSPLNECLPAVVADNKASVLCFDRPRRREAAFGH